MNLLNQPNMFLPINNIHNPNLNSVPLTFPEMEYVIPTTTLFEVEQPSLSIKVQENNALPIIKTGVFTNFFIYESLKPANIDNELDEDSDYDINLSVLTKKTYKVKAKIKSVEKFIPKPFI